MIRAAAVLAAVLAAAPAAALLAKPAAVQGRLPSHCQAIAEAPGVASLHRAAFGDPLGENRVRVTFIDHAMFMIETPGGLTAVTDYVGYIGATDHVPTVVTMNNAHRTHWTDRPDPRIPHVLRGWAENGVAASHHLDLGEMLVRNVTTDVRSRWDETVARKDGNSIFIFEVAGLCIGHLGHLHHEPSDEQYAAIGRLDVVMAPVDGGYTVGLDTMTAIVGRLRSSVVLPMHWFSGASLNAFLARMEGQFDVVRLDQNSIELSLRSLPSRPTIIVLEPAFLR
jgi:L-ascorbate metabolism protein UlaG (beta-lactamase superfamily)